MVRGTGVFKDKSSAYSEEAYVLGETEHVETDYVVEIISLVYFVPNPVLST